MRQKGFVLILIVIVIALVAVVGAYYFGTKNGNVVSTPTDTPSLDATNSPIKTTPVVTPTIDPTANWKTYTDPESRYSFRYPQKYNQIAYNEGSDKGIQISSTANGSSLIDGVMIKTLVISSTSAEAFAQKQWDSEQNQPDFSERGSITKIEPSILDGKTIYSYTVSLMGNVKVIIVQLTNTTILRIAGYYAGSETKIPEYRNMIAQILSTFKFTQ